MTVRQQFPYETVADILYRMVSEQTTSAADQNTIANWSSESDYNRKLFQDILSDSKLRADLLHADKNQFWKIVITHRTALHNSFGARHGNFWRRLFSFKRTVKNNDQITP
jgi:hypothetical protein